jgi:hypothetical protein
MPNLRPVSVHSPAPRQQPTQALQRRAAPLPEQAQAQRAPQPQQQAPIHRPQQRPETDVSATIGTRVDVRA